MKFCFKKGDVNDIIDEDVRCQIFTNNAIVLKVIHMVHDYNKCSCCIVDSQEMGNNLLIRLMDVNATCGLITTSDS